MKRSILSTAALILAFAAGCTDPGDTSGATSTAGAGGASTTGGGGTGGGGGGGSTTTGQGGEAGDVSAKIAALPGVTILTHEAMLSGEESFMLAIAQPVDHNDPSGPTFPQRIALHHRKWGAPTVLASTGYNLYADYEMEPTALVGGNQLLVEHRFFTPSRPDPADWHHLRIWQAASDHHRIVEIFKPLYTGEWLSTGGSKGGMTSVYHRRFFPDDVNGTIAYVAPQSYGDEDPRYLDFLQNVGDPACRGALVAFQKSVLSRRAAMTSRMIAEAGEAAYSQNGVDGALDFAVIELPFGFWQYQSAGLCASIPTDAATDDEVWAFLNIVDPPSFWGDETFLQFEPYYYQAAVELGYPAYDDSPLAGLLSVPLGADVAASQVAPGPTKDMALDGNAMPDIATWLATEGQRMLFIYGEDDPYSAAMFELGGATDAYRFTVPGGNHGASISDLPDGPRTTALAAIAAWSGVAPMPVPPEVLAKQREARMRFRPHKW